jgi:hypothetical protein
VEIDDLEEIFFRSMIFRVMNRNSITMNDFPEGDGLEPELETEDLKEVSIKSMTSRVMNRNSITRNDFP